MKRYFSFLCALGLLVSAVGCSESESSDESKKSISVESSEDSSTSDAESKTEESSSKESSSKESDSAEAFTVEEQVLWEADGVTIKATGISEDDIWGSQIDVLVENNSDKDVGISTDAVIVNDYMISDLTSIQATAGNKVNDKISLFTTNLEAAGIENINKVELYFHTYDPASYETLQHSDCITLSVSGADTSASAEATIEGTTLYDANGIKIVGQYVDEDSFWGTSILLYIENNTEQNVIIQNDDLAINGFMVNSYFSQDVYAGKKAVSNITILESDLEDNGITSIDTVETTFQILDENYSEIANSGKINFSAH